MTDIRALPNDHVLKPLETRMLEMCNDLGPLQHLGGNFVAALRVFADRHPGLADDADTRNIIEKAWLASEYRNHV